MARLRIAGWRADSFRVETQTDSAVFVFRFRVWWRKASGINLVAIHDGLADLSSKTLTEFKYSGPDSIAIRLRESSASLFPRSLVVDASVIEHRQHEQPLLEAELARLMFLRDHVFTDAALGRIWWLLQQPELVTAVGNQIFLDTLTESAAAQQRDVDLSHAELLPILVDFVTWLSSGQQRAEHAVGVLAAALAALGHDDLQKRLESVHAEQRERPHGQRAAGDGTASPTPDTAH